MQSFDLRLGGAHGARDSGVCANINQFGLVCRRISPRITRCINKRHHIQKGALRVFVCVCAFCKYPYALPTDWAYTQNPRVLIIAERKAPNNAQPHVQKRRQSLCVFAICECRYEISIHRPNDENKIGSGSHIVHAAESIKSVHKLCVGGCSGRLMSFSGGPVAQRRKRQKARSHFLRALSPTGFVSECTLSLAFGFGSLSVCVAHYVCVFCCSFACFINKGGRQTPRWRMLLTRWRARTGGGCACIDI
jgi:hypothetical protein